MKWFLVYNERHEGSSVKEFETENELLYFINNVLIHDDYKIVEYIIQGFKRELQPVKVVTNYKLIDR